METWLLFIIGILFLILIPFSPQLVRLRIRIFRWLRWNGAVNLLENHFQFWVVFVRVVLFVLAVLLLYISCRQ